jgi:hypothetical protein
VFRDVVIVFDMKVCVIFFLVALMAGCGSPPEFSEYHGPAARVGTGGTTRMVNGMEVWDSGVPDRPYRILGDMHSAGGRHSDVQFELEQIVKAANLRGADALILANAEETTTGINLYSGRFERSPSVDAVLIKYLDR